MQKLPKHLPVFDQLLSLEKIEQKDLACLSAGEKKDFIRILYQKAAALEKEERDAFLEKTAGLLDSDFIWEFNHTKITLGIEAFVARHGSMPNKAQLAVECGLSRLTIRKHLKELNDNSAWAEQKDAVDIMTSRLIGRVLNLALKGDLKATKIYLDYAQKLKGTPGQVNHQNNFIQINKTVINQQTLQQLKPEQLQQIEEIVSASQDVQ